MPRAGPGRDKVKLVAIVFAAVFAASGFAIYMLYAESQEQARTILGQAQSIVQKSQQITDLESAVKSQGSTIINQSLEISGLREDLHQMTLQVLDLSKRLGIAVEEIEELTPKMRDYYVVGVESDGDGVVVPIEIKIVKGTGVISANINKVELLSGAQNSIRTAAGVASAHSGVGISDKDITVSFVNSGDDIVTVDGGSAGASITVAIIATLLDKDPDTGVLMTGTISPDGKVGPVGFVEAKAKAAAGFGAHTFLAPSGQAVGVAGINVVGVSDIDEAIGRIL